MLQYHIVVSDAGELKTVTPDDIRELDGEGLFALSFDHILNAVLDHRSALAEVLVDPDEPVVLLDPDEVIPVVMPVNIEPPAPPELPVTPGPIPENVFCDKTQIDRPFYRDGVNIDNEGGDLTFWETWVTRWEEFPQYVPVETQVPAVVPEPIPQPPAEQAEKGA